MSGYNPDLSGLVKFLDGGKDGIFPASNNFFEIADDVTRHNFEFNCSSKFWKFKWLLVETDSLWTPEFIQLACSTCTFCEKEQNLDTKPILLLQMYLFFSLSFQDKQTVNSVEGAEKQPEDPA